MAPLVLSLLNLLCRILQKILKKLKKKFSNYYRINKIATEKFNTEIIVHPKHFK